MITSKGSPSSKDIVKLPPEIIQAELYLTLLGQNGITTYGCAMKLQIR